VRRADHSCRGVLPSVVCQNECDHEASILMRPWPTGNLCPMGAVGGVWGWAWGGES
jgi:hypothetical protein